MMPRLGERYDIEMETISKPRKEYQTDDYLKMELPVAPAIMLGEETLIEKSDISEEKLKAAIRKHIGLPTPEPQKKGILSRLFNR